MDREKSIRYRYEAMAPHLGEKGRRLLAAMEARSYGWGGIKLESELTSVARPTIGRELKDLDDGCGQ